MSGVFEFFTLVLVVSFVFLAPCVPGRFTFGTHPTFFLVVVDKLTTPWQHEVITEKGGGPV
jgi:hypothetical protein